MDAYSGEGGRRRGNDGRLTPDPPAVILEHPYHLSYPVIFEHREAVRTHTWNAGKMLECIDGGRWR